MADRALMPDLPRSTYIDAYRNQDSDQSGSPTVGESAFAGHRDPTTNAVPEPTMKRTLRLIAASQLAWLAVAPARADVIFNSSHPNVPVGYLISKDSYVAQSFQTDAGTYTLANVVLHMETSPDNTGNYFVKLYDASGANSRPGTELLTLTGETHPHNDQDYTYTGSHLLTPNTAYWIMMGVPDAGVASVWQANYGFFGDTPSVGTSLGISISTDQGGTWDLPNTDNFLDMIVNADLSPVPEPGQRVMLGLALLGVVGFVSRQRRARSGAAR